MFLVGAALTAVAFVLSLLLKEVPLRATTHEASDLAVEEAAAGGDRRRGDHRAGSLPARSGGEGLKTTERAS